MEPKFKETTTTSVDNASSDDIESFGYRPTLRRTMSMFTALMISFSMVGITGGVFPLFGAAYTTAGGIVFWLFIPIMLGILLIALIYGHLAARIPITGYAYQWSSRITNPSYGWFCGWNSFLALLIGGISLAVGISAIFTPQFVANPTQLDYELVALIVIVAAAIVMVTGIKLTSILNNIGATIEVVGTVGIAIALFVGYFFFKHATGFGPLLQTHPVGQSHLSVVSLALGALLPAYIFLGWEGAADLAEETQDSRRVAPKAMRRAILIAGPCVMFVFLAFTLAMPYGVQNAISQKQNTMIYVIESHFGRATGDLMYVVVFIAMFATLIADLTAATRSTYALARDNMLPGSRLLGQVHTKVKIPIYCVLLVAVLGIAAAFVSSGIIGNAAGMVNVTFYATYVLTTVAVLFAVREGRMPRDPEGSRYFSLGKWLVPVAIIGVGWSVLIMIIMTVPSQNHVVAEYFVGAEVLGALWYFVALRRRLSSGTAGLALRQGNVTAADTGPTAGG